MGGDLPYWRLSAFYFFYFALLGTWLPYWSLYLKSLGYSSGEIGYLSAIVMLTKIVAPSVWGWVADRYQQRVRVIRYGAFLAVLSFSGVYLEQSFWWLALVVATYSFFWNAVLAQFDVLTLSHLGERFARYSLIRVWGSIGFVVAVLAVGWWLDHHPIVQLLYLISLLLSGIWLASLLVANANSSDSSATSTLSLKKTLAQPLVWSFLLVSFLLQLSHGPYYTFFSIFLENAGYTKSLIGGLWSLGVIAEVLLFLFMHRVLARYSLRILVLLSLALTALRWMLIAYYVDNLSILIFAQCLHAASFGSFHAVAIETIRRGFGRHQGQGMALYSGLSYGAGGAAGALLSGWLWDVDAVLCFVLAGVVSVVALILAWWGYRE